MYKDVPGPRFFSKLWVQFQSESEGLGLILNESEVLGLGMESFYFFSENRTWTGIVLFFLRELEWNWTQFIFTKNFKEKTKIIDVSLVKSNNNIMEIAFLAFKVQKN